MLSQLFRTRTRALFTVIAWLFIITVLFFTAPSLGDVQSSSSNGTPDSARSTITAEKLKEYFPEEEAVPAIITVAGAMDNARQTIEAIQELRASSDRFGPPISAACQGFSPDCIPADPEITVSDDEQTQLVVVSIHGDPSDDTFRDDVDMLREALPDGTHVTGPAGTITDAVKVFAEGDRILMVGTVLLVLVILLAVYRSPLLAVLPLAAVTVALLFTQKVGAILAERDIVTITAQSTAIMTVLLFGVGTDYALVLAARWKEFLREGLSTTEALVKASYHTTSVILSSAGTIILAMLALLATSTPTLQGFGFFFALGIGSMALVAFTFLPAVMVLFGRATLWPTRPEQGHASNLWTSIADFTIHRPKRVLAASFAALALCSLGLMGYQETYNFTTGFRVPTDSAAGQQIIADMFGPGETAPSTMLLEGPNAAEVAAKVSEQVHGAARTNFNPAIDVADNGEAARLTVVLPEDPYSAEAIESLTSVTDSAKEIAGENIDVSVAGFTAENEDTQIAVDHDIRLIIPLVFGIIAIVLAILLRSWLAPIYLVATLALSFLAALGLTTFISVTLQGDDGFSGQVAVYIFVFLTALGVDYTIFIMERLRQELPGNTMHQALRSALITTGGVVSSAGLILAATFAVLMTQPIRELYQFGLGMSLGILLDTFLIRPLLVPAIVTLLGNRALTPQKPSPKTAPPSRVAAE